MQIVIASKNDKIIALKKRVMDLTDSTVTPSTLCQNTELDSLHGMVDKLVQKIDLSYSARIILTMFPITKARMYSILIPK